MATNLKIDDRLLCEALRIGGFKTKKETVNQALTEFIQHRKQLEVLSLRGKVEFFEDFDYKKSRMQR